MWLRRSLFAAVVLFAGLAVALADDKKDDKKPDEKKDDKKATLAWKLEEKKPFYQKMTTTTDQTMKVQGQDVKQKQTQTFYFVFTPEKKDGETWTIKQKIEGVQMDIDIGGTKISYDSQKSETTTNPLNEFFKALVGSEFTLTVAPKDKDSKELTVTKIEGREDFLKKLSTANPQMAPLLNQILTDKALMEMAQPTFASLPGTEVAAGKTWERGSTLEMGPLGKYENTYKYSYTGKDPKDDKLESIKVETTLKYKEPAGEAGGGGLPFKIKKATLDPKPSNGTIKYDPAKGRIDSSEMTLELSGNLDIEIGGQSTKVDLEQKQTVKVENTDKSQMPEKPK
jgi:hypothetical protein